MNSQYLIILFPMISGVIYHLGQKSFKANLSPFLLFSISYLIGSILMLGLYFLTPTKTSFDMNLLSFKSLLPVALIVIGFMGIELGFLYVYKSGLPLSSSNLMTSLGSSILLLIFGITVFQEQINTKQWLGILFAFLSLFLLKK